MAYKLNDPLNLSDMYNYVAVSKYGYNDATAIILNVKNTDDFVPESLVVTTNIEDSSSRNNIVIDSNNLRDNTNVIIHCLQENEILGEFKSLIISGFVDSYPSFELGKNGLKELEKFEKDIEEE